MTERSKMMMAALAVAIASVAVPAAAQQDAMPDREARAAAMFDRIDANKDGMISRAEWDAARSAMAEQRGKRGKAGGWARLDTNGDGRVSAAEWQAAGRPAERFTAIDANKDGVLTPEELRAERAARMAARAP